MAVTGRQAEDVRYSKAKRGQPPLTTGHVTIDGTTVRIRLGPAPITLPGPVADLTRQLLDGKRGHATTGAGNPSPWLFPGG